MTIKAVYRILGSNKAHPRLFGPTRRSYRELTVEIFHTTIDCVDKVTIDLTDGHTEVIEWYPGNGIPEGLEALIVLCLFAFDLFVPIDIAKIINLGLA
jgi:hypothetical protein